MEYQELFRSASAYSKKRLLTTTQPHDIIFKTVKKVGDRMSLKNVNHQKRSFTWSMEKPSAKDYFLTVFIFAVCTLIGLLFQKLNFTDTNIVTIYILGVLLTSIVILHLQINPMTDTVI